MLITGGSGFFGRAMAETLVMRGDVERVCIYSRDEYKQAVMRQSIKDARGVLRFFIGDVRDQQRLTIAMRYVDTVIHAAALKRVEVGEYNPEEMIKTNVLGAMNVIHAARTAEGPYFNQERQRRYVIALSTDKACSPINTYGASKLLAEKLFIAAGAEGPTAFAVTRYGNVTGSTGSVIPTWRKMIAEGAKVVPVSDPRCTRFWMDIEHAVGLVLWTRGRMFGGELVVPTLPAYRLGDLATAMGVDYEIKGLGQGEKIDESMVAFHESHAFRYVEPQLVAGGVAADLPPNVQTITTRMLTVDELRELLKTV